MHVLIHALTAVPFLLVGEVGGALSCVLPDLPILGNAIRGVVRKEPLYLTKWNLVCTPHLRVAYLWAHSVWPWTLLALILRNPWVLVGGLVHLLLDRPVHHGSLRARWFTPWRKEKDSIAVVPVSGGFDSAVCLAEAIAMHGQNNVFAFFFAYGQPYLRQERAAVTYLGNFFHIYVQTILLQVREKSPGVWDGRNFQFLDSILEEFDRWGYELPAQSPTRIYIYLGTRAPSPMFDNYGDANVMSLSVWVSRRWKDHGPVQCEFPVLMRPDFMVRSLLRAHSLDPEQLFSSKNYKYLKH